ncbi:hypothetical protein ACKU27_13610 [Sphingobium yanoikuyae]|uniref:hypothetical protein n=1 Tax=Sphingobium yanoikuyae TaxID=13690 RepID=UPI003B920882
MMELDIDDLKNARVVFNAVPLTFSRRDAMIYTGIADKLFRELERSGSIRGRRIGRNGQFMYLEAELRSAVAALFGDYVDGPIEF